MGSPLMMITTAILAVLLPGRPVQDPPTEEKLQEKLSGAETYLKTAKEPREFRAVVQEGLAVVDAGLAQDFYETAAKALAMAERASRPLRDNDLNSRLKDKGNEIKAQKREFDKVKSAWDKWKAEPTDASANLALGRFMIHVKSDWDRAILFLRNGSDKELQKLAELDFAAPKEPAEQVGLGDKWWDQDKKGLYRDRAIHWYKAAWPRLTGLAKERVRTRAREYAKFPPGLTAVSGKEAKIPGWGPMLKRVSSHLEETFGHTGKRSVKFTNPSYIQNDPNLTLPAGAKVILGGWFYSEDTDQPPRLSLVYFSDAPPAIPPGFSGQQDFPFWQYITGEFTIPEGTKAVQFRAITSQNRGLTWFDDASMKDESGLELLRNRSYEENP